MKNLKKSEIKNIPESPGVYIFKDKSRKILYIGKAANLKKRIKDHLRANSFRDSLFSDKIYYISFIETDSEIEALLLESKLIKKYSPKFNVLLKDSTNYFYVARTKEDFPTIIVTHQPAKIKDKTEEIVGPFVDGTAIKKVIHFLRKVFPYRMCNINKKSFCSWYYLDQCCYCKAKEKKNDVSKISKICKKNTKIIFSILKGKYKSVIEKIRKEMEKEAKKQNFEKAIELRNALLSLQGIIENAKVISEKENLERTDKKSYDEIEKYLQKLFKTDKKIKRIEGYDTSNIQGKMATGSMVCFVNGKPEKKFYRIFKIKTLEEPNDFAMIKEILERRLKHKEWGLPDLIIIDGGKAQLSAGVEILKKYSLEKDILISAIAKKHNELFIKGRKNSILLKNMPESVSNLILQIRDESHRFARKLHFRIRKKRIIGI